jgi:hypothetical protein
VSVGRVRCPHHALHPASRTKAPVGGLFFVAFFAGCVLSIGCMLLLALQVLTCFLDLLLLLLRSLRKLLSPIFRHFFPFVEAKRTVYVITSYPTTNCRVTWGILVGSSELAWYRRLRYAVLVIEFDGLYRHGE